MPSREERKALMPADTTPGTPEMLCPSCAPDGGYGTAVAGRFYRCPVCHDSWSPAPETRFGRWLQQLKARLTS